MPAAATDDPRAVLDMDLIVRGLFLGSQGAEEAPIAALKKYGISHVLQLGTDNVTMSPSHPNDLKYLCISIHDKDEVDIIEALRTHKALDFIDCARQQHTSILVHCQMGMSRSAITVIAYLMTRKSLSFWDALVQTIAARPRVQPNPGFCKQARGLEVVNGNLQLYKAPANDLFSSDQEWLIFLDQAQSAAAEIRSHVWLGY